MCERRFVSAPQLVSFGLSNEMMVTFKEENLMTFRNLFLKGYKDQQQSSFALYTKADVYDHIGHVVSRVPDAEGHTRRRRRFSSCANVWLFAFQYVHLQNLTVGNLAYAMLDGGRAPLSVCQVLYSNSSIDPENETFYIDPRVDTGTKAQRDNKCCYCWSPVEAESVTYLWKLTHHNHSVDLLVTQWKEEVHSVDWVMKSDLLYVSQLSITSSSQIVFP